MVAYRVGESQQQRHDDPVGDERRTARREERLRVAAEGLARAEARANAELEATLHFQRIALATVLQVVAVALYSLFIGRDIPVPSWLQHAGIDGLKNLLAGIVAVMLGVLFLEQVITTDGGPDLLPLGIAIAAVILALSYFIRSHPGGH